ncbi:MAG: TonB-dependent receptor plug domain-containing protein [Bacteroidota bacterium]
MIKFFLFLLGIGYTSICIAQIQIRGIVTAADSQKPLKDVLVQVKDSELAVTTDKEGSFALTLGERNAYDITAAQQLPDEFQTQSVLVFSLDGFSTVEREVVRSGQLDVSLSFLSLADVAASAKSNHPTSFTGTVGGHQLLQPYIGSALQGKVAGLRVQQSGMNNVLFQLRSNNSLANSGQPLILLDDIWLANNDLSNISPDNIAYIEVLKGASASARYGSRGGNGIVKIYTKRGDQLAKGNSRINFRTEWGVSRPSSRYNLNTLTNRTVLDATGAQPVLGAINANGQFNQKLPALRDYQEEILFQNGALQSHQLSIESRSFNTNFLAAAHRTQDVGILQSSDGYTRHNLRFNLDHQINDKWQFHATTTYTFAAEDRVGNDASDVLASTLLLTPMFDLSVPNEEDGSPHDWDIDNTGNGIINPLYLADNQYYKINTNRLIGNWAVNYQILPSLHFEYATTIDRSTIREEEFIEKGYLSSSLPANFGTAATFDFNGSRGGAIRQTQFLQQQFVSQADLVLKKKILGLDAEAGLTYQYESLLSELSSQQGENLNVAGLRSLSNPQDNIQVASSEQLALTHSGIGFLRLDYKDKYHVDAALRQERASLFGEEARTDLFHQVGLSYFLSKDLKIKGVQELQLRAAMGTAGIRPRFEQRFSDFTIRNGVIERNQLANPQLRPILVDELEVGGRIRFLRAIEVEGSYSQTAAKDQILLMPLSGGTGFEGQWQNTGTLSGKTIEASMDLNIAQLFRMQLSGLSWSMGALFHQTRSTIAEIEVPPYVQGAYRIENGTAWGSFYGRRFATDIAQLSNLADFQASDYNINELGYVIRQDAAGTINEQPILARDDQGNPLQTVIGTTIPDFQMDFSNSFAFKGLELYILLNWQHGGSFYNATKQRLYEDLRHADVSTTELPSTFYETLADDQQLNAHFLEDATFWRLRELSLTYTFNQPKILNSSLERLQIGFVGRNVWNTLKEDGFLPDVTQLMQQQLTAIDQFSYPQRRMWSVVLKVVF